jgi:hypothetical protein
MARRKKSSKKRYSRRRSVGAIMGKNALMNVVGIAAGAAAGRIVSQKLNLGGLNPTIKSAGTIVLGIVFPKILKGSFGQSVGTGMVAAGALGVMQGTGVLQGIDDAIDGFPMVGAFNDVGAIEYDDTMGASDEIMVDDTMGAMDEEF